MQLKIIVLLGPSSCSLEKKWERAGSGQQFLQMNFLRKWHLFLLAECFNEKEKKNAHSYEDNTRFRVSDLIPQPLITFSLVTLVCYFECKYFCVTGLFSYSEICTNTIDTMK